MMGIEQPPAAIRLRGDIDLASAATLAHALRGPVEIGGPVTIDLSDVSFLDSTGIGVFARAAHALRGRGCLILHGATPNVRRVLELVQLDDVRNLHVQPCAEIRAAAGDGPGSWSRTVAARGRLFELCARSERNLATSRRLRRAVCDRRARQRADRTA